MIPENVKKLFNATSLVSFATVDKNGNPNVVAVFWKKIVDHNTILLIDNFFKTTKQNILDNNKICIAFWDSETEEAYKIKGIAKYHTGGSFYELGKKFIQEKKPGRIPKGVVEITITEIYDIKPGETAGKRIV